MKISIITVSFNSEETITQTIESVLNQTYDNIEYIIVDGASADKTVQIAESYCEKFAVRGIEYRMVSEPDKGIYDAMNKGIGIASGKVVGMINSDDWYEIDALEKVAAAYERTHFDVIFATVRIHTNKAAFLKKPKIRRYISSRHWNHPTMFVAKSVYNQELYALDNIYDDFDFYLRMRKQNRNIVTIDDVLANFRFGGISNQKTLSSALKRAKIQYVVYRKNGYGRLYYFECLGKELAKIIVS